MSANDALLILFGMISGGSLGYITAWKFARKLEFHEVVLAEWDNKYDPHAPAEPNRHMSRIG